MSEKQTEAQRLAAELVQSHGYPLSIKAAQELRHLDAVEKQRDQLQQAGQHAMKALEALNQWDKSRNFPIPYRVRDPLHTAITALRQALAAEQQATAEESSVVHAEQQAKPVAWYDRIVGMTVSMDVSTGESDEYNRVFGEVTEVIPEQGGSPENVILAVETERNFETHPQPAQQTTIPAGYKLVPVEPTREMLTTWIKADVVSNRTAPDLYRAMLAAAPEAPAQHPLTDDRLFDVFESDGDAWWQVNFRQFSAIARAVEREHRIE